MSEDWRSNPALVAMVDAVLLGLIRAHQPPTSTGLSQDEKVRLRTAKKALFGISPPRGHPKTSDLHELLLMAEEYVKDRGDDWSYRDGWSPYWRNVDETSCRSTTALATWVYEERIKARSEPLYEEGESKIRHLQRAFDDQRDALLAQVLGWPTGAYDDVIGDYSHDFSELLRLLGIPFSPSFTPSHDANSMN